MGPPRTKIATLWKGLCQAIQQKVNGGAFSVKRTQKVVRRSRVRQVVRDEDDYEEQEEEADQNEDSDTMDEDMTWTW
jgi:hypothetical protein